MLESSVLAMTLPVIVSAIARFRPVMLRSFLCSTVVFICCSAPAVALPRAQSEPATTSKPTVLLTPSERKEFQLDPNQRQTFLMDTEARTHVEISFQQTHEMLSVIWSGGGQAPPPGAILESVSGPAPN